MTQNRPASQQSVDVIIPVYNEERDLPKCVATLRTRFSADCPYRWRIVIANNASTDGTLEIAKALKAAHPGEVDYIHHWHG